MDQKEQTEFKEDTVSAAINYFSFSPQADSQAGLLSETSPALSI